MTQQQPTTKTKTKPKQNRAEQKIVITPNDRSKLQLALVL
jgi:hypothetical protein